VWFVPINLVTERNWSLAKKQKKTETIRLPTKHQLSKWERQKQQQRYIYIAGAIFFVLILAFVGYGYYDVKVKPFHEKVLRVNDTVIDMNYYLEWFAISLRQVGTDKASTMADTVAEMTLGNIMQNELMIQRAPKLGISVKDSDVDNELAKLNLPKDSVRRDAYKAQLLGDKLMSEYLEPKVPNSAKQVNVQAMFLETESSADEVANRVNNGESFGKLAKEFSVEEFTKEKSGELGWLLEGLAGLADGRFSDSLLDDIAFSTAPGMMSKPTYDSSVEKNGGCWLLEVTERDADQSSHVRGILLGSEKEAIEVSKRLKGGADFATVAKEMSQHLESKDFGGDLGWVQKGYGDEVVVKVAFELPIGTVSDPVRDETAKTKGGYWLIKVLEKDDNRQVDKETRDQLKAKAFQDWMEEQRKTSEIELYLVDEQKTWAVDYTLKKLGASKK
jgi:parvulin-like peptidyl-prolyl isomerase